MRVDKSALLLSLLQGDAHFKYKCYLRKWNADANPMQKLENGDCIIALTWSLEGNISFYTESVKELILAKYFPGFTKRV